MGDQLCFCGQHEELLAVEEAAAKWNRTHLLWWIADDLPGMLHPMFEAAVTEALNSWQAVCGLTFSEAANANEANIVITTGRIDGASGTLAWSELPNGSDSPLTQKYDTSETWRTSSGQGIDLVAVACHELGHALGLSHDGQSSGSLMAPYYSPKIRVPQTRDVQRIQALYGPRVAPAPIPVPNPLPTPAGSKIVIEIYNADRIAIPGYKVTRE